MKKLISVLFLSMLSIFIVSLTTAAQYPHIVATKTVSRTNPPPHDEGIIDVDASYTITRLSTSRAKSEASSSVLIRCVSTKSSFIGIGQIRGTADKDYTKQNFANQVAPKGAYDKDTVIFHIDANGIPNQLTLQHFEHRRNKVLPKKLTETGFQHPDANPNQREQKPPIYYSMIAKHGVVADTRPHLLGLAIPFPFTYAAQDLSLSKLAALEKNTADKNSDGEINDTDIVLMFDPYAEAKGSTRDDVKVPNPENVKSAYVDTTMPEEPDENQNQYVAPPQSTPMPTDNTPNCNLCTDGCSACPITGACGHTYANSEASNHTWGTAPCGDNTHVGYLCQINASDHEWVSESCSSLHAHYECDGTNHSLQASCTETDSNGNTCTVTSFYACESHTHVYPAPTVSCARQACSQQVSNRFEHRQTCSAGHTYWTCISGATHNHTTVFTCSRPGCSVTFTLCSNGTCNSNWGTHPWHWAQ